MSGQPTIYAIKASSQANSLQVDKVWAQGGSAGIAAGLTNFVQFPYGDGALLLGQASDGSLQSYKLTAAAPYVTPIASKFALGGPCDILKPFVIGGRQHLFAYRAKAGVLHLHQVNDDLTLSKAFEYYRARSPGLTSDWTMVQPITYLNRVYYATYDFNTGMVELFDIDVTAVASAVGVPPLQTLNVWSWTWAKGWTHFAFFEFGGENFFFKINVMKPNVNIDHLNLDPGLRSNEVSTQMKLEDSQALDIVRSLYMEGGAPYLVNYLKSGKTTFYRVHGDCQGWTMEARLTTVADASDIATYRIGDRSFALFY